MFDDILGPDEDDDDDLVFEIEELVELTEEELESIFEEELEKNLKKIRKSDKVWKPKKVLCYEINYY